MTPNPADAPLGALLTVAPPVLSEQEVAAHLTRHWDMSGTLEALTSERDLNFRLTTPKGRFVLKLANAAEPPQSIWFGRADSSCPIAKKMLKLRSSMQKF